MSVPVRLTRRVSVDHKNIGSKTMVSITFDMDSSDVAAHLRDALWEAFRRVVEEDGHYNGKIS